VETGYSGNYDTQYRQKTATIFSALLNFWLRISNDD